MAMEIAGGVFRALMGGWRTRCFMASWNLQQISKKIFLRLFTFVLFFYPHTCIATPLCRSLLSSDSHYSL